MKSDGIWYELLMFGVCCVVGACCVVVFSVVILVIEALIGGAP